MSKWYSDGPRDTRKVSERDLDERQINAAIDDDSAARADRFYQAAYGGAASLRSIDQVIDEPWALPHMRNRANDSGCSACAGGKCRTPEACRLIERLERDGDDEFDGADAAFGAWVGAGLACLVVAIVVAANWTTIAGWIK